LIIRRKDIAGLASICTCFANQGGILSAENKTFSLDLGISLLLSSQI